MLCRLFFPYFSMGNPLSCLCVIPAGEHFPCGLPVPAFPYVTAYSARLSSGTEKRESRVVMKVASAMVVTSLW